MARTKPITLRPEVPRGQVLVPAEELAALRRDAALWREKGAAKPAAKPAAAKKGVKREDLNGRS
jgi:hypothetical protein